MSRCFKFRQTAPHEASYSISINVNYSVHTSHAVFNLLLQAGIHDGSAVADLDNRSCRSKVISHLIMPTIIFLINAHTCNRIKARAGPWCVYVYVYVYVIYLASSRPQAPPYALSLVPRPLPTRREGPGDEAIYGNTINRYAIGTWNWPAVVHVGDPGSLLHI